MLLPCVDSSAGVVVPSTSHMCHWVPVVNNVVNICFGMMIGPCIFAVTFCGTRPLIQGKRQELTEGVWDKNQNIMLGSNYQNI